MDEISVSKERMKLVKAPLTSNEVSQLRGAIGTIAWKSAQTGPHFQADAGLLLSEVPKATIHTVQKTNKLIREIRRESHQSLLFPHYGRSWQDFVFVTWCDAGQQNRPDRSSTLGVISGLAPKEFVSGEECSVAILNWKSGKTPRQCLGSNGAEVQAVTEGEDGNFKLRAMWCEIHGEILTKETLYDQIRNKTLGALVMDTRGIFDAITRNLSSLHGLRSSRAGYELTLSIQQALRIGTSFRWVNGLAQLADCLTKASERKVFLQFLARGQAWRLIHDESFTAGRKLRKKELEKALKEQEHIFLVALEDIARQSGWPWENPNDPRGTTDESSGLHQELESFEGSYPL